MSQMIRYRNRDKRVNIKLGDLKTKSHGLELLRNYTLDADVN
jgi:hypothetical protein